MKKQKQQIEKDKELIENADILDENTPNIESIKNKMSGMALGLPIAGASTQVDMNPLKDIKAGYEAYKEFKRPYEEAAGRQFNLAGATPEVEKPMEMVSGLVSDPLMYFNGPLGVGAGALQMGIEALPSESGKENKFQKLQKMMSSKKQEGK